MLIGNTKSICPVCLKTIDAKKLTGRDGNIYLEKTCSEHGLFSTLIWEGNIASYLQWNICNTSNETPVNPVKAENECPNSCGLCSEHLRKGCCMLLELTSRCNLSCPVCFASAGNVERKDLTIQEISGQYDFLMEHGGPFNIQLSGGEPTMRDDLPEIIELGYKKGFNFFQLNTNGVRIANEEDYLKRLSDAGLTTVYLQYDGVTDDVFETLRGKKLLDVKKKAIENCAKYRLGVVLVPVIAPGVNDTQVGDILKFGLENMPCVRGVHFQPISYFGRCSQKRPERPITIPKILKLIESQTDGRMKASDFAGGGAENPYCSFHASYRTDAEGNLRVLPKKSGGCCCSTTSDDSRTSVSDQWSGERCEASDGFDEFLNEIHNTTFAVSGMIFQDAYNFDIDRVKRCYICEVDGKFGMVPFCAYNLTDTNGNYLYRGK